MINITLTFYENNFIFFKAKTISKTSNIVLHLFENLFLIWLTERWMNSPLCFDTQSTVIPHISKPQGNLIAHLGENSVNLTDS